MMLWVVFALMTAAAVLAVLWPLGRARMAAPAGNDLVVYQDQLAEIERDRAANRIPETEAEAARIEVSRRLLAAADAAGKRTEPTSVAWRRRAAAIAALVLMPLGACALYLHLGSPDLPGEPLAARSGTPPEQRSLASLVAQVEAHLARNPDDGRGWEVIAP